MNLDQTARDAALNLHPPTDAEHAFNARVIASVAKRYGDALRSALEPFSRDPCERPQMSGNTALNCNTCRTCSARAVMA